MPPLVIDEDVLSRSNAEELRGYFRVGQAYTKKLQDALQWGLTLAEDGSAKPQDWNAWETASEELLGLVSPASDVTESGVTPVPEATGSTLA